jgi:hypothetical protein
MKISEAIEIYIKLRDKKAQLKSDYEALAAPITDKLDKLEAKLLDMFNKTGSESSKTEFGTAYVTTRATASVADREVFLDYVKANEEWDLVTLRAPLKESLDQFRLLHGDIPPGISLREERVVNVRRSA